MQTYDALHKTTCLNLSKKKKRRLPSYVQAKKQKQILHRHCCSLLCRNSNSFIPFRLRVSGACHVSCTNLLVRLKKIMFHAVFSTYFPPRPNAEQQQSIKNIRSLRVHSANSLCKVRREEKLWVLPYVQFVKYFYRLHEFSTVFRNESNQTVSILHALDKEKK